MADDFLQRGARMIERVRSARLAHPVAYIRAGGDPIAIAATTDTIDDTLLEELSLAEIRRSRDFLVTAADLAEEGQVFRPAVGDVIRETVDGDGVDYEVTVFGSEPCWSFDDTLNLRIRVHTRRKGTAP